MADDRVTFELPDRAGRLAAVRLVQEIGLPEPLGLARAGGVWRLAVARPDVDRMEYLYEIEDHNAHRTTITDPANPRRVGGAFGDKSVREFAGYVAPSWLAAPADEGQQHLVQVDAAGLDGPVEVAVWAPAELDPAVAAPLLVVHDGPEYARLGGFTHYLGAAIAAGELPPVRAALLDPGDRNGWYSANAAYARALCADVLPEVEQLFPSTVRLGVGASLGALGMLHAHRSSPGTFAALFLQSGSFFTPELDPQEVGFSGFAAVTGFVAGVRAADTDHRPVPAVLTCGTVEENLANNEAMAATLGRLGNAAQLVRVRDAHNYTAWRDALHPHLTRLVAQVAGIRAA